MLVCKSYLGQLLGTTAENVKVKFNYLSNFILSQLGKTKRTQGDD